MVEVPAPFQDSQELGEAGSHHLQVVPSPHTSFCLIVAALCGRMAPAKFSTKLGHRTLLVPLEGTCGVQQHEWGPSL